MSGNRAPYLTRNRALELAQDMARLEERTQARLDEMSRELAALRDSQAELIRAQAHALLAALRATTAPPLEERNHHG